VAQTKILLDSNSYFRLAKSIHPLLFEAFGEEAYTLYVLPELEKEYAKTPRLHCKFPWVLEPEFQNNRSKRLSLSKQQKNELPTVYEILWDYVQTELPGPSRVDVTVLSYAYILGIPVVTDDYDMIKLAEVFEITVWKTLDLLKLMLDCAHIDLKQVRRVVAYWGYVDDYPKDFTTDYRRLFGEAPPM